MVQKGTNWAGPDLQCKNIQQMTVTVSSDRWGQRRRVIKARLTLQWCVKVWNGKNIIRILQKGGYALFFFYFFYFTHKCCFSAANLVSHHAKIRSKDIINMSYIIIEHMKKEHCSLLHSSVFHQSSGSHWKGPDIMSPGTSSILSGRTSKFSRIRCSPSCPGTA